MSLVAKLSQEAVLMSGGLSLALWGGGGHLEKEERERERKGRKRTNKTRKTHTKCM